MNTLALRLFTIWLVVFGSVGISLASEFFSEAEKIIIQSFGPWPPPLTADPSNSVSQNSEAISLGEKLFSDRRLSLERDLACSDCHVPDQFFTDGTALNSAHGRATRNTPGLLNLRWSSWFGWGGAADSLWAQSIRPLLSKEEMKFTGKKLRELFSEDIALSQKVQELFEISVVDQSDEALFVIVGKLLAAYEETLISGLSEFDRFNVALSASDNVGIESYLATAKRGLKIFIGKGRCNLCHFGPTFTNGEFGDIGVTQFITKGRIDKGRYQGIKALQSSPFNLLGEYNDDQQGTSRVRTEHVTLQHRNWGEFKIPSLRNAVKTAPYMHNGSIETLAGVVEFYSNLDEERLHIRGEKILRTLNMTPQEKKDLVAFLRTL